ncbi:MAG: TonB-dependent receptor [Marinilabiliaceae bacterium]|nr:TonB-dependent receptor [Marinilabiliaceae bacterium]
MLNDIKYGDLFLRRVMRLFFLLLLFLAPSNLSAQNELLDKHIDIGERYQGSTKTLIDKVASAAGITISYSNKVYVHQQLTLDFRSGRLRDFLDAIFSRFAVEYIVRDNKVIVSAKATRMCRLSGYCRDALTGEVLIGANVYDTLLIAGSATNGYGFFSVSLPCGRATLRASFVGYTPVLRNVNLESDTIVDIRLQPSLLMKDVDVVNNYSDDDRTQMDFVDIPMDQVKAMPTLFGESDIIRMYQKTPGVQSGEEGFGGLSVRGGDTDQNIYLLDDVPLYSATHLMGMFSVFNAEAVNSAQLYKGAFPARYGGRMSSVFDVKLREGDMQKFDGYANLGLLASTIMFEGPIVKDKVSFITSARRTYFDVYSSQIQRNNDNRYSFFFYDISAKLNYRMSPRNRLYVSFFVGKDALKNEYNFQNQIVTYGEDVSKSVANNDEQKVNWNNLVASIRWNHLFGSTLFSNFTLAYTHYRFNYQLENYKTLSNSIYENNQKYYNGITDVEAKVDFNWYPNSFPGVVRFGANGVRHFFFPGLTISTSVVDGERLSDIADDERDTEQTTAQKSLNRFELHSYLENDVRMGKFSFNVGVHLAALARHNQSLYLNVEPRASFNYEILPHWRMQVGYSHATQFMQQLRIISVASPADMWLPISSQNPPPRARQWSLQSIVDFGANYSLSTELYYKDYVRKQTFKTMPTNAMLSENEWDNIFCSGSGVSKGLELFLHRKARRLSGWIGYSWSHSYCRYAEINDGQQFDADNDCRHSASIYGCYKINDLIDVSATWSYHSGAPVTISDSRYTIKSADGDEYTFYIDGKRNAYRMSASHSLNIGMNIRRQLANSNHMLSFGVYNVYGRQNPMFTYWKANDDGSYRLREFSLIAFPWPYVKYSIRF